jgi:hypothetical protein
VTSRFAFSYVCDLVFVKSKFERFDRLGSALLPMYTSTPMLRCSNRTSILGSSMPTLKMRAKFKNARGSNDVSTTPKFYKASLTKRYQWKFHCNMVGFWNRWILLAKNLKYVHKIFKSELLLIVLQFLDVTMEITLDPFLQSSTPIFQHSFVLILTKYVNMAS